MGASPLRNLPRSKNQQQLVSIEAKAQSPSLCLQDFWFYPQSHLTYQSLNFLICKMGQRWYLPYLAMVRTKQDNTHKHSAQSKCWRTIPSFCPDLPPFLSGVILVRRLLYLPYPSPIRVSSLCTTIDLAIYFTPTSILKCYFYCFISLIIKAIHTHYRKICDKC